MKVRRMALAGCCGLALVATPALANLGKVEVASISPKGDQFERRSGLTSISADGRYVAFTVDFGRADVFVYDRKSGKSERITDARRSDDPGDSFDPSISDDGRYVAFVSDSSLSKQSNFDDDIFVFDRKRDKIEPISIAEDGSEPNRSSFSPEISGDGRYVGFVSNANDLVTKGGKADRRRPDEKTFQVWTYDRSRDTTELVSANADGSPGKPDSFEPSVSRDGRFVAYYSGGGGGLVPDDPGTGTDIIVRDIKSDTAEAVSVPASEAPGDGDSFNPDISADGRYVAFASELNDLASDGTIETGAGADIFVRDRQAGTTVLASPGDAADAGRADFPSISADGGVVSFESDAPDPGSGDATRNPDVFVANLGSGMVERVSVDTAGGDPDGASSDAAISANGRVIAFASKANDLIAKDRNPKADVFIRAYSK